MLETLITCKIFNKKRTASNLLKYITKYLKFLLILNKYTTVLKFFLELKKYPAFLHIQALKKNSSIKISQIFKKTFLLKMLKSKNTDTNFFKLNNKKHKKKVWLKKWKPLKIFSKKYKTTLRTVTYTNLFKKKYVIKLASKISVCRTYFYKKYRNIKKQYAQQSKQILNKKLKTLNMTMKHDLAPSRYVDIVKKLMSLAHAKTSNKFKVKKLRKLFVHTKIILSMKKHVKFSPVFNLTITRINKLTHPSNTIFYLNTPPNKLYINPMILKNKQYKSLNVSTYRDTFELYKNNCLLKHTSTILKPLNINFKKTLKLLFLYNANSSYYLPPNVLLIFNDFIPFLLQYTNFSKSKFSKKNKIDENKVVESLLNDSNRSGTRDYNLLYNKYNTYSHSNYSNKVTVQEKTLKYNHTDSIERPNGTNCYTIYLNNYLLKFLEEFLQSRVWVKLETKNILSIFWKRFIQLSIKKNFTLFNKNSKLINLTELLEIIILTFNTRDFQIFLNFIKKTLEKNHFKKHKKILYALFELIRKNNVMFKLLNVKGFAFDIRGKVGVTGNAKKRHIFFSYGKITTTSQNVCSNFQQISVWTPTGQMGITCLLQY